MKDLTDLIYKPLYEGVRSHLQLVGILLGIGLIVLHLLALVKKDSTAAFLKKLPRDTGMFATVLLTIDFVLAFVVVTSMDLGEFYHLRWLAQAVLPVMYLALCFWVNDYLGARASGIFMLLIATPVLNAAFLKEPATRLLLPALAYLWLTLGLFWIGMPATLRDQVAWLTAKDSRYRGACIAGTAYGAAILVCALVWWGSVR